MEEEIDYNRIIKNGSDDMSRYTGKINAFFYQNRNKGIPNLMLYIAIGNVIVYLLSILNRNNLLFYDALRFDYEQILHLQLCRLLSYPLTYLTTVAFSGGMGILLGVIGMFFFYYCGRVIEANWGTLRFNCYYFCGMLLMDLAAMLIGLIGKSSFPATASYLNMSLFLAVATLQPEAMVRIYFFIPVKMKWLAWFELGYTQVEDVMLIAGRGIASLTWIMPIFAILNYFLFFGKSFAYVLPDFMQHPKNRAQQKTARNFQSATRPFEARQGPVREVRPYRFKCTVCGRTDVSNPNLEFRYCSKCAGYRCYCIDHINKHVHISD